jgi:hypothetical protein
MNASRPRLAAACLLATLGLLASGCPERRVTFVEVEPADRSAGIGERSQEYLEFATAESSSGSVLNAIAHMERDLFDPAYTAPEGAIDVDDWSGVFADMDTYEDTRDFDGLYLVNALLAYEDHPYLTPALWDRIRSSLLEFKYWYTDPTPPLPNPDDPTRDWDNSFYWTENHQIIYHAIEYLAGQRFPNECFVLRHFAPSGDCSAEWEMTGLEHKARAREKILRWLEERWELGFSEWHSNIYYQKDATPLLTLVEHADDEEIRARAAIILDVLLLDIATHAWKDVLGVTHGRSAMKDKRRGPTNDTWGITHLLFRQQEELGFVSTGDAGATLFARAKRYRVPEVVIEIARDPRVFVDRTRMSLGIDEGAPLSDDPEEPPGHGFEDTEENFTFWWGLGAWTVWQVVPLTIQNAERYNLWPTDLLRPFAPLRSLIGDPPNVEFGTQIAQQIWPLGSVGFLKEANTYTYRTPDFILSTAQDYRKGANSGQVHSWQATLGSDALVFTTHPMNPVQPPSEWISRDEGEPGYWSGTASSPRSAQHENVGIHIYSPRYADGGLIGFLDFEALTHAYFPQEHFDEVVKGDHWIFGRKDDAYVALYSWRPTVWQEYPQEELDLLPPSPSGPIRQSFDLVAPGGPDNVWIVECGRAVDWESFEAFRAAVLGAAVTVEERPSDCAFCAGGPAFPTYDVRYDSPSQGRMTFGWRIPFTVAGEEIPISDYPRVDNPWVRAERDAPAWLVQGEEAGLFLDWERGERTAWRISGPGS